jgi:hypothetical protein
MKRKNIKKLVSITLVSLFSLQLIYIGFEPQIANAVQATDSVLVTLDVDSGISITTPADVTMAPHIGVASDGSIGSVVWTVKTNVAAGYTLAVKASSSPALVSGGNSFADYTEAVAGTPEQPFTVASGDKEFGYSAFGTDTSTGTWGVAASCGSSGMPSATQKYVGFTTSDKTVASRASVTPTAGIATTVCFAAAQNNIYAAAGTYTATITATATTL